MDDVAVLRLIERAPLRTVRWEDVADHVTNASRTLARMADSGALTRLAHGVYVAPPNGADGRTWRAPLETAALALGTARFGQRRVVLTGMGAARYWHALPRAVAETVLAVPVRGRHPVVLDRGGVVRFVHRDPDRVQATLEPTVLGSALVATPAQTMWDLLADRAGRTRGQRDEALRNLRPRVTHADLSALTLGASRVPAGVREQLDDWDRR